MSLRVRYILGGLLFLVFLWPVAASMFTVLSNQFLHSRRGWNSELKDNRIVITAAGEQGPAKMLRMGDEVIAFATDSPEKAKMPVISTGYWQVQPGTRYSFTIKRDGQVLEFPLQTVPFYASTWVWVTHGFVNPLSKLVFLITGLVVFLLRPRDKQAVLLALMLGTLAAVIPVPADNMSQWLLRPATIIQLLCVICLPICLHLFLVFPECSPLLQRFPRLESLLYLLFGILVFPWIGAVITAQVLLVAKLEWVAKHTPVMLIGRLTTVAYMLAIWAALVVNYRTVGAEARRRLRVMVAGSGIGLVNLFLLPIGEFLGLESRFPTLWAWFDTTLLFTLPLIPLSFAYAIIRHRVIPVSLILRRGIRYLLVSRGSFLLEAAAVWVVVTVLLSAIFRRLQPRPMMVGLISAAVGIVVWNGFRSLHQRYLAPLIDRRFFRQSYNAQHILSDLTESFRTTTDLPRLLEQVAAKIQSALQPENVTIFLRNPATGDYYSEHSLEFSLSEGRSVQKEAAFQLPHQTAIVEQLETTGQPLEVNWEQLSVAPFSPSTNGHSEAACKILARLNSSLLLPLATKDEILGIISLGPRLGDLPFSSEDEELLMSVAGPATIAIQNARLVEQMVEDARRRQELEVENEARAKELEEARQLQLSMLPRRVPQLPNLDIAAYMKTATEVGGDYYDFHLSDNGTLTIVVGDATGHGLKAGTVVTATKSLFNHLAHLPDIPNILAESSRALKQMNLRSLFMAMTMVKLNGNSLTISSAGMPPVLIYRATSREVEVIQLTGLPLGSVSSYAYRQQQLTLDVGDVVMLMSDGFPERFNQAGEMLGYAKAEEVLAAAAHLAPQSIIEHYINIGEQWADSHAQDDDVTFVVLKVK